MRSAPKLGADPGLVRRKVAGHKQRPAAAPKQAGPAGGDPGPEEGAAAAPPQAPRPLSARERRERSLLEMAIALPSDGEGIIAQLTPAHLSSAEMIRARDWLAEHLEHPLDGIPHDDEAFAALVTQLVMGSEREPASRGAMELNLLWLERAMVDAELENATANGGDPPVELQKRHAELSEQIASFDPDR